MNKDGHCSAMPRLLAIALAFLMGCPYCWCCTLRPAAQSGASVHECCMGNTECTLGKAHAPLKKSQKDSCDCDLSKTKRETHPAAVVLPAPLCILHLSFEQRMIAWASQEGSDAKRPLDKGPPPGSCPPLYVSHCVLRL